MFSPRYLPLVLSCLLLALAFPVKSRAQIYADVTVAGAVNGTFTIDLQHDKTPAAVANFIGLATGRRGWLDRLTGAIRSDGFYQGVTFHRVIAGFVSQAGSRAGDGTDGPGYVFKNEIHPALSHDSAYVVAMANSGQDTNGSQFYITAAAQPGLNGRYTVFGRVIAGTAVCDAINATPTTGPGGVPRDRPLSAITITGVNVHGPSYAAFDLAQPLLPTLTDAAPVLRKSGAATTLGYDHRALSEYFGFHSADLTTWVKFHGGYHGSTAPAAGDLDVTTHATGPKRYFRLGRADYTTCANPFIPTTLAGKSLYFGHPFFATLIVNSAGTTGTWVFDAGGSTPLSAYTYTPRPYSGFLYVQLASNGGQMSFDRLDYTSATGGTFVGRTSQPGFSNVSGTFSSSP